ncbi:hypothetical protein M427DRAFT_379254 [Gonapodya prolifera JEL478]|uniref:Uncharacterized protein n=1 Tax=Gonapodya prolifera (strain JEL478) TaxID=1344416 RepID=A0A139AV76_GONPJ|nr:hypothetical protein M427DRAFT_379254 [Gonapodya prolifera JEL478]|eukprot:KXS20604.1 hypothetical protein M427DRAFT_379254 [Gonapodya prolifera JEL478]
MSISEITMPTRLLRQVVSRAQISICNILTLAHRCHPYFDYGPITGVSRSRGPENPGNLSGFWARIRKSCCLG